MLSGHGSLLSQENKKWGPDRQTENYKGEEGGHTN